MPHQSLVRVAKKPLRLDDEVQFIRSWIEKPLSTGAVMPSSKALARTMARYVDPASTGPVIASAAGFGVAAGDATADGRVAAATGAEFLPPVFAAI